jgi:SAM-dependent methyltransferase
MNWYENFFNGIALDLWRAAITPEQTRAEADFLQKHLAADPNSRVLDVPCGNGRLAIELTRRGHHLTGIDIASEFIEEAKRESGRLNLSIEWYNRDMREITEEGEFDGAFCFGNSFGYLEDDGSEEFLQTVARSLKAGARFIIDAPATAECLLPRFAKHSSFDVADIKLEIDRRYDHEQGRVFSDYNFIRDGIDDRRPSSQRIYPYKELAHLLSNAGLEIQSAFGSLEEEPFALGAKTLLLVCVKVS